MVTIRWPMMTTMIGTLEKELQRNLVQLALTVTEEEVAAGIESVYINVTSGYTNVVDSSTDGGYVEGHRLLFAR